MFWFWDVLRSVSAIYCLGFCSGYRGLPWYGMICCVVVSALHFSCFYLLPVSWFVIFSGALHSVRLDLSWSPFGLVLIVLGCFLPVGFDLPRTLSCLCNLLWISASGLLWSALLYSFVVLICAALIMWSLRSVLMCSVLCTVVVACSDLPCSFFCLLLSALVSRLVVVQCFAVAVCCRFQVDLGYAQATGIVS